MRLVEAIAEHPGLAGRLDAIHRAIENGRRALLDLQRDDGSWEDHIEVGPIAVATQLVLERIVGTLSEQDVLEGTKALRATQHRDGGFPGFPHASEGSIAATAMAVTALGTASSGPEDACASRARAWLDARGGMDAVVRAFHTRSDLTAVYLAAAGLVPPDFLPRLPLGIAVAPGVDRLADGRVHAGNTMVLVTLLALSQALRPAAPRASGALGAALGGALRAAERHRAAACLGAWQNPDGSFNQALFPTQLMTLGMHALGLDRSDDRMRRALGWLDRQKRRGPDGLSMQAIPNDVWSTAMATRALLDSGLERSSPVMERAALFLIEQQLQEPQPRANQRRRGARRTGGWAFQRGNPTMPDCDDAGLVLAALGAYAGGQSSRSVFESIDRGVAWLRDMQNPDGGWPAYVWNLPSKPPGPMFLTDLAMPAFDDPRAALAAFVSPAPEAGDPATEGVTARVLWGLGASGVTRDDPAVCRAITFLQQHQCEMGAFWDRWMTCYVPGTATVITALASVGEDMNAPYVRRAVDWLERQQNDDGGFGELAEAFRDPLRAGCGPSMPALTAFALCALVDARRGRGEAAHRAANYLLDTQTADGLWPNCGWVNPYVPPDTFYEYSLPARCMPLAALGRWCRCLRSQ